MVIVFVVLFASFAGLRKAELPVTARTCSTTKQDIDLIFVPFNDTSPKTYCSVSEETLSITVSFPIYLIAFSSFIGWFMLVFFLATGLVAFPFDLINAWRFRPLPMKEDEFNAKKNDLAKKIEQLLQIGTQIIKDKSREQPSKCCNLS